MTTNRIRTEVDALTGEVTTREFTEEENAQADLDEADIPFHDAG